MNQALEIVADYLFPSDCVGCGKSIAACEGGLCSDCTAGITLPRDACPGCGGQVIDGKCVICIDRAWYPDRCFAAAEYSGAMKALLKHYKFQKRRKLHGKIAEIVHKTVYSASLEVDVVTAVPMGNAKVKKRGFNQSELVARVVAKKIDREYRQLLKEVGKAGTQKDLNYLDRFLNVLGRYEALDDYLRGESVLLIDDVFTTGATINECARLLKSAGAGKVYAVAFARRTLYDEMQDLMGDVP